MTDARSTFRPPAVPLLTNDPNFSVWSFSDQLYAEPSRHWTGTPQPLTGLIRIDGRTRAFLGRVLTTNVIRQERLHVDATTTHYEFACAEVRLRVAFGSPLLLDDLDRMARPLSWVAFEVESLDGTAHAVAVDLGVSAFLAIDQPDQEVHCERVTHPNGLVSLCAGTTAQEVLMKMGDDLRIDWGQVHLCVPPQEGQTTLGLCKEWELKSLDTAPLPDQPDFTGEPKRAPLLCGRVSGTVDAATPFRGHFIIGYDDRGAALEVFGKAVPGWSSRSGKTFPDLLLETIEEFPALRERCAAFDAGLNHEAESLGGQQYRDLCALAYRQAVAAHKLVADDDGNAEFYSKECFSNGCMGTVDVSYPSMPLFLRYNPELVKAMMRPVFRYARMPEWNWDFAPHDVGRFPRAFGQAYGRKDRDPGGELMLESQMPVEECGNLLVMALAVAQAEGNAGFATEHWDLLSKWARYLIEFGVDPGEQLCTDDYGGHLAHNANLAVKAIVGVGAYARLCEQTGLTEEGRETMHTARNMVAEWLGLAADEAGHFRLAYHQPGSWSLKYNLLWDRLLGLHLFPEEALRREWQSYRIRFLQYGIPNDNRKTYAKTDWMLWCACLEETREGFDRWVAPLWRMLNETPHRVPFTDWFYADTAAQSWFQNRSVQGGLFAKFLFSRSA